MKNLLHLLVAASLFFGLSQPLVHASVVIAGTRVVFPAQDGEVTVRLTNENALPALVEAWIDSGDVNATPDTANAPFLITPPLFRMDAHKEQSLRILATPATLPSDQESVFWLNVLEIPPKPTGLGTRENNTLQLALRSRIKLFFRPAHLAGEVQKAPALVTWRSVVDGSGYALEITNPTAYHLTLVQLSLTVGGKQFTGSTGMVNPRQTLKLSVEGLIHAPAVGDAVAYQIMNDYGGVEPYKGSIAP